MKYLKTMKQRKIMFWTLLPTAYIIFLGWLVSIKFVAIVAAMLVAIAALSFGLTKFYKWCNEGEK